MGVITCPVLPCISLQTNMLKSDTDIMYKMNSIYVSVSFFFNWGGHIQIITAKYRLPVFLLRIT